MKAMLARQAAESIRAGSSAQQAAEYAISFLQKQHQGLAGIICVDFKSRIGIHYNTPKMARGYVCAATEAPVLEIK